MINMISPFNCTSYGYTGCYLLREMVRQGQNVAAIPISDVRAEAKFGPELQDALNTPFHYNTPCLKLWHQHDLTGFTGKGRSVGYTIFELEQFSDREKHSVGYPTRVVTCSEWGRQVILDQTNRSEDTVKVVPLGIDPTLFKPTPSRHEGRTIFLNAGKWEIRKGHDILIQAFNKAFEPDDPVELWMMPHNFFLKEHETAEWVKYYAGSKLGDKVTIIPRLPDHESTYNIMSQAHCGVFPSRAEGWNLELLEMMSMGKPVITTNCTAHTEFANDKNSHLISMSETEVAADGKFFAGTGNWYKIGDEQVDQLVEYMRSIHKQNMEEDLPVNQYGIETGEKYTWSNAAKKLIEVILWQ